ncbi:MAG: hypothetical protein LBR42_04895 [Candidatus Methanoplasma sp.]|jgi:hypothetical protein|nr:hypothetical protein [Candidatus Methanoplasma sp.]
MSDFTAIFTDLSLASLNLECFEDDYDQWRIGDTLIDKEYGFPHKELQDLYPDMNMYFTWYPLNEDLIVLAREYLDRGERIIFLATQFLDGNDVNYLPREEMGEYTIDVSEIPLGGPPMINGTAIRPDTFNIYNVVKGKRSD